MNDAKLTKLIEQAIKGDTAAFEEVMRQKARQIIYISVKTMRNRQDGEDAAQEAMLKMYQNIDKLKDPDAFYTWMYRIVARTCIDQERKKHREDYDYLEMKDELNEMRREFLPQDYVEDVDKRETLMRVINELPADYRIILLLFYYEGMSYQEIAAAMDMAEKAVANVLVRGRRKIREQMERSHSVKASLSAFKKAAALPVLSQAFQLDAAQLPVDMVESVLTRAGIGTGVLIAGSQAAGGTTVTTAASSTGVTSAGTATSTAAASTGATTASTVAMGTSAKVIIGLVAAATVAGGAAYGIFPGNGATNPVLAAEAEEAAIITLADMIGEEAAQWLLAFGENPASIAEWEDFLQELQAEHVGGIKDGTDQYKLYRLEKQDKQLLLLEQLSTHHLQVVFRFTDCLEAVPEGVQLLECMQGWRQ